MLFMIFNVLILFRICLIFVFIFVFYMYSEWNKLVVAIIFVIVGIMDWIDGYLVWKMD